MKNSVFVYPGLNGLFNPKDRINAFRQDEVKSEISRLYDLSKKLGKSHVLDKILSPDGDNLYGINEIPMTAAVIISIQLGITKKILGAGFTPKALIGCSLGDLSKFVISGAVDYEELVTALLNVCENLDDAEGIGQIFGLSIKDGHFSEADFRAIAHLKGEVSPLSERFINVSIPNKYIQHLQEYAKFKNWRLISILPYPLHSSYLLEQQKRLASALDDLTIQKPKIPCYSAFSCDWIDNPKHILTELKENAIKPVLWDKAMKKLSRETDSFDFINMGPCQSLINLSRKTNLKVPFVDCQDLNLDRVAKAI